MPITEKFYLGILLYRILRNERKPLLKTIHAAVLGVAFLFGLFALVVVFVYHEKKNIPNMYSFHSWLGLLVIIIMAGQWIGGFTAFLFPGLSSKLRSLILPIHQFNGSLLFVLSCAVALMGFTEKAFIMNLIGPGDVKGSYGKGASWATIMNVTCLLIVIFAGLVIYLVNNLDYKRKPLPEEQQLQMSEATSPTTSAN